MKGKVRAGVEGGGGDNGEVGDDYVQEIERSSIHPLDVDKEGGRRASAGKAGKPSTQSRRRAKFLVLEWQSRVPMWSRFRAPGELRDQDLALTVDRVHLVLDQHLIDYALCVQVEG